MLRALGDWLPPVVYAALIWFFSAMPAPPGSDAVESPFDKPIHALEYAVLAALLLRALSRRLPRRRAALAAVAIAGLYAGVDEVHQHYVPPREASVGDAVADVVGAAAVAFGWARSRSRQVSS